MLKKLDIDVAYGKALGGGGPSVLVHYTGVESEVTLIPCFNGAERRENITSKGMAESYVARLWLGLDRLVSRVRQDRF